MSHYQYHVFFCLNQREPGERQSCNSCGADQLWAYAKERVKALKLNGDGKVRINKAGCLERCEEGPVIVIYPEETWYTYIDKDDIDEIVNEHLLHGRIVERLLIPPRSQTAE
ncbi:(2Fe-2S) ferredoxin domain-containing protein [Deefgea piscis]|uniref:(2Fe-2S) ferredoxin domain-containing protein n=1 Tax=Deefgea piscis TaxID=2739061 RepID=A0A6M8SRQ1_9NEIS|nr:(2Fe-2S) ferredoxin domain-containing protein [Deefgea piscis]QKJ67865.1 (2Fe-2S) ferredoxin domain-containing protein [Deefgea piscis]